MKKDSRWHFREIEREIRSRVEAIGFVKRGPVFERDFGSGFHGFIGFNRDRPRGGAVGINPVLGVSCDAVYERICDFRQERLDRTNVVSSPLGYLTPEARFRNWYVILGEDNEAALDEMFAAIHEYGLLFYEEYQSIDAMIEAIEHKTFWHPDWAPYTYPIMLVMKGRTDEAVKYVETERDRRLGIGGGYEGDYQRFAEHFLKDVDAHHRR